MGTAAKTLPEVTRHQPRGRGSPVGVARSRRHVLVERSARGVTQPAGRFGKQRPGHAAASPRRGPGHSPGTCTARLPAAAGLPAHSSPTAANSSPCPRRRTVSPLGGEASSSDAAIGPRAPTCATPRTEHRSPAAPVSRGGTVLAPHAPCTVCSAVSAEGGTPHGAGGRTPC